MIPMVRRLFLPVFALLAVIGLALVSLALQAQDSSHRGRKYKAPEPQARVEVTVLRDASGKPIENAAVIFHIVGDKGNMELKTNEDGKAVIDVLPQGCKVTLQVIAKGFQTYGGDYQLDKAAMAFEVRLKRPGEQYSIYKHSETAAAAAANGDTDATPTPAPPPAKNSTPPMPAPQPK
jgi:hypothetical protein